MSVEAISARVTALEAQLARLAPSGAGAPGRVAAAPAAAGSPARTAAEPSFAGQLRRAQGGAAPQDGRVGADASPYADAIRSAAARHGLDPALLTGLIRQESNFDPGARSPAGALGLGQLMPATAAALGVRDPLDPEASIDGAARYLRQQLDAFGGDPTRALAAYNAGPGAVRRFGGVPPFAETQGYVQRVLHHAREYGASTPAPAAP